MTDSLKKLVDAGFEPTTFGSQASHTTMAPNEPRLQPTALHMTQALLGEASQRDMF